jgi:poly(A) polymerase
MNHFALAKEIVSRLTQAGFIAYFAGGWVRDYLMDHPSDDIDIATDAPTEVIINLFPRTILVGLSFGVVVVVLDGQQFEVATFRRDIEYTDGRKPLRVERSSPEEDASRRDFTINGMFYDPVEEVVHDFVGGAADIKLGVIRTIGDPYLRFTEDRLRMIRAVRFASRFAFVIDEDTQQAIIANADTLFPAVAMERIWQEVCKMVRYPHIDHAFIELHRLGLLPVIFPQLKGIHLNDIKKRVVPLEHYPRDTDPFLFLLALFPGINRPDAEELCRYLKVSNAEISLTAFYLELIARSDKDTDVYDKVWWAHAYAHKSCDMCLKVVAAHMPAGEMEPFLQRHRRRALALDASIQRILERKPVVTAAHLVKEGIVPGKSMGMLLSEAERIAILSGRDNPEEIIDKLKQSPQWPKEHL